MPEHEAETPRIAQPHDTSVRQREIEVIVRLRRRVRVHHPQAARHAQMHEQRAVAGAKQQVFRAALERIDWRTSAIVLEKLIRYESVHAIQGWPDLRRRLQADRRCYAFFHPQLPEEPLIFIEVALTREISTRVQPLLDIASPVADPAQSN